MSPEKRETLGVVRKWLHTFAGNLDRIPRFEIPFQGVSVIDASWLSVRECHPVRPLWAGDGPAMVSNDMGYVDRARASGAQLDDYDWRSLEILDEHGWMVQQVLGDENHPAFAYTVGATLHRPDLIPWELVLIGLDLNDAKRTLNHILSRFVTRGEALRAGRLEDVLDGGLAAYVQEIPAERVTGSGV